MYKPFGFSVLAAMVCLAAPPAWAGSYTGPGFSADAVIRDPKLGGGRYTGRYYLDRGGYHIRIDGRSKYKSFVFNSFHKYLISVDSNRRMDIEEDKHGALATQFGDAPCAGFRNAIKAGSDSMAGREIRVWRCNQPKQALLDAGYRPGYNVTVWYDPELKHFIRKDASDGVTIELKNIVPGRQAPALFDMSTGSSPANTTARVADVESVE